MEPRVWELAIRLRGNVLPVARLRRPRHGAP
jgi:hypothetical protein